MQPPQRTAEWPYRFEGVLEPLVFNNFHSTFSNYAKNVNNMYGCKSSTYIECPDVVEVSITLAAKYIP